MFIADNLIVLNKQNKARLILIGFLQHTERTHFTLKMNTFINGRFFNYARFSAKNTSLSSTYLNVVYVYDFNESKNIINITCYKVVRLVDGNGNFIS